MCRLITAVQGRRPSVLGFNLFVVSSRFPYIPGQYFYKTAWLIDKFTETWKEIQLFSSTTFRCKTSIDLYHCRPNMDRQVKKGLIAWVIRTQILVSKLNF